MSLSCSTRSNKRFFFEGLRCLYQYGLASHPPILPHVQRFPFFPCYRRRTPAMQQGKPLPSVGSYIGAIALDSQQPHALSNQFGASTIPLDPTRTRPDPAAIEFHSLPCYMLYPPRKFIGQKPYMIIVNLPQVPETLGRFEVFAGLLF